MVHHPRMTFPNPCRMNYELWRHANKIS